MKCCPPHTPAEEALSCNEQFLARLRRIHGQHHRDFQNHHRNFRRFRPVALLFTLLLLYLLFQWQGFEGIGILLALLIILKETIHFFYWQRLEKRIFEPIERLKLGIDEIANGNYRINVPCDTPNDLSLLILSFNEMAQKLYENEQLQAEYEENRKTLVANISHDLKTPMTAIQGYVEALLDGNAAQPDIQDKYLRTIHSNTLYMNRLIDDLFLFSKLDMDKLDFAFETLSIRPFMADFMEECKFSLAERGIDFDYTDLLAQDALVSIDGKRFQQAFNNLIANAVRHGRENDCAIQAVLSREKDMFALAIQDNGPGIAADQIPYIFDRFFRIDRERQKDQSCTGLGLAIARELVEAHGGSITVASVPEVGSCFTIWLPLGGSERNEGEP